MAYSRHYSLADTLISQMDALVMTVRDSSVSPLHASPAEGVKDNGMSEEERVLSGKMMKVDHLDQVASIALYRGSTLASQDDEQRTRMSVQATYGFDRLLWCRARMRELDIHPSPLVPLFYIASVGIGYMSGKAGTRYSNLMIHSQARASARRLEHQLTELATTDKRSRAVIEKLSDQQEQCAYAALEESGAQLAPLRWGLQLVARVSGTVAGKI